MKTTEEKYSTVITHNTFFYNNFVFQDKYEGYLNSVKESLLIVKNEISLKGLQKEIFEKLLERGPIGLNSLLALTGISNETFKRMVTLIRIVDDEELASLTYKSKWCSSTPPSNVSEWSDIVVVGLISKNEYFKKGIVNLFFEGASNPFLSRVLPLFELKKLGISKLNFDVDSLIDTIIRYKAKGSYAGQVSNNPENLIRDLLKTIGVNFESGDLTELIDNVPDRKRTMDFIIPSKTNPLIIIESSYLQTTSSGQGDKSKTEIAINDLLKQHYPKATFIGFIDGIGWYVRKRDLLRMVVAYEDVFTFSPTELERFRKFVLGKIGTPHIS